MTRPHPHRWLKSVEDRAIQRFTRWFVSEGGVYQTFLITMAVVIFEAVDRAIDPHAFLLMAILTVYSAITQPALAFATGRDADRLLARIDELETKLDALAEDRAAERQRPWKGIANL